MLSISNVTPQQGANYFKEENYYSKKEAQEQSKWFGVGAANLGLSGNVQSEQFKNLLDGYSPDGKKTLSGKKIDPENRRAGFDLTFSAPKSVSLAALYGGDKNLELAHHTAVDRALRIYEQQYAQARVWDGKQQQKVNTGNIVAAQFHHTTSREKDPQLHTHCIVLNCTQLENGKWRALTNEELYNNEMLLGAIYRNELACEARKLGYEIEERPDGLFEIKGYSEFQLECFSKRRQQIVELVGENASAAQKDWAALQTRAPKGKELPRAEQLGWWQAQNLAFNLQIQHPVPQVSDRIIEDSNAAAAVRDAIEHCSERTVAFKRKALDKFIFSEIKSFSYTELEKAIEGDPELIAIFDGGFTTQTAINRELATIKLMQQGKNQVLPIADDETIALHLAQKTLTQGQHEAIALALTTTDSFIGWQGVAGAGKTYALNELRAIATERGYTIKGFAPSSEAAKVLGEEVGIESNTVASLLVSKQTKGSDTGQIWIVDEAGLLSAKDAYELFKLATNQKARVILVGDTKQLSAVEAGNPFKSLQSAGMQTAYLNQSLRQRVKDLQESVDMVAAGRADLGISKLEMAGRIAVIPDAEERLTLLVKDYMALTASERAKTLVLAGTNSDRLSITHSIRTELKAVGVLGETANLTQLKAKDLTQVQARYSHHYAVGDVVVPTRDYKRLGLNKFQPYIVEALDKNSLTLKAIDGTECVVDPMAFRKTVYNQQSVEIAVGDRLKWTRNDRKLGRRNGQEFVVTAINGSSAQVMYSNSKTDEVDLDQLQHLDYAIVSTTYSSQGKTADRVLIAADKTMGKESFYVAVSRAKYDLKIYTEDKKNLLKLAQRSRAKETAIELVNSGAVASQSAMVAPLTAEGIANQPLTTTTNEQTTNERTNQPTQPASNSQQFEPGDGNLIGRSVIERLNAHSRKTRSNRRLDDSSTPSKPRTVELRPRTYQPGTSQPAARVDLNLQGIERVSNQWRNVSKLVAPAGTNQKSGSFNADGGQTVLRAASTGRSTATRQPNPELQGFNDNLNVQLLDLESTAKEFARTGARTTSAVSSTKRTSPSAEGSQSKPQPTVRRIRTADVPLEPELRAITGNFNSLVKRLEPSRGIDAAVESAGTPTPETSDVAKQANRRPQLQLPRTDQTRAALLEHESQVQQISDDTNSLVKRLESSSTIDGKLETGTEKHERVSAANSPADRQRSQQLRQFAENANAFIRKFSSVSRTKFGGFQRQDERVLEFLEHQETLGSFAKGESLTDGDSAFTPPVCSEQHWLQVRRYLVQQRCLPARLVDGLHAAGKLYADNLGHAVFLQSNSQAQVTGAKSLDINGGRYTSKSQPALEVTDDASYFRLTQGKGKLSRIVLTTSPIEAMSLAALEQGQHENRTIYIDIDIDKQPDIPRLQELIDRGVKVEVAFGTDEASVVKAQQVINSFPGVIRRKPSDGKSWNEQLRWSHSKPPLSLSREAQSNKQSYQTSKKPTEPKSQQRFDPKQQLLETIRRDRQVFKSASDADLKIAIKGLVAGRSLEQISQNIASSSSLVKHWETRERPSTQAIAKTIKYVEQLYQEAQSEPAYYQQLYHKYLKQAQKANPYLPRTELDRAVANVALKSHPQESIKSILKYSLAAQVGSDEYIEQTLAVVRQQAQLAQEPQQKTRPHQLPDFEYGD